MEGDRYPDSVSSVIRVYRFELGPPAGSARTDRARALTRRVLAGEIGVETGSVKVSRMCAHCGDPEHGRPVLVGGERSFSVSHSGDRLVVATTEPELRVGIDLELVRDRPRLDALAHRTLDDDAYAAWCAVPEPDRLTAFLHAWTAKEAYLKAIGLGIATALRDVAARPVGFAFHDLDLWPDAVATVAVDAADATWRVMSSDGTAG